MTWLRPSEVKSLAKRDLSRPPSKCRADCPSASNRAGGGGCVPHRIGVRQRCDENADPSAGNVSLRHPNCRAYLAPQTGDEAADLPEKGRSPSSHQKRCVRHQPWLRRPLAANRRQSNGQIVRFGSHKRAPSFFGVSRRIVPTPMGGLGFIFFMICFSSIVM